MRAKRPEMPLSAGLASVYEVRLVTSRSKRKAPVEEVAALPTLA